MKRRYLLRSLLLLGVTLLGSLGFFCATETGLRGAVGLAQRFLPGRLSYGRLEGRLIGPLRVEDLRYRKDALDVALRGAELDWFPIELLAGRLHLALLRAEGVEVHLPSGKPDAKSKPLRLRDIALPVQLAISQLAVTDIRLWPPGAQDPVVIEGINLQAKTQDQAVVVEALSARAPQGVLTLAGQLGLVGEHPLALRLHGTLRHPTYGPLSLKGNATGALDGTLALALNTAGVAVASLQAQVAGILTEPVWSAQLTSKVPDLGQWVPDLSGHPLSAELQAKGRGETFQVAGHLRGELPEMGAVQADLDVSGNPQAIQVSQLRVRATDGPLELWVQADLDRAQQTLSSHGHWHALAWPLTGEPQIESPSGEFALDGTFQDYRLALKAALAGPELGALNAEVQAAGTDQGMRISKLSVQMPLDSPRTLEAAGELSFAQWAFQVDGRWQSLAWPLSGTPQVASPNGAFQANGNPQAFQFVVDTDLQGPNLPEGTWHLEGRGSDQALERLALTGKLLDGEVQANASVLWHPAVSWKVKLSGKGLNPGAHWPQLPGRLAMRLQSEGGLVDGILRTDLNLEDLAGTFRERDVRGEAKLSIVDQDLAIEVLKLTAGSARLEASGRLARRWDLRWQLEAPDLGQLLPGARGVVSSTGRLTGPRETPQVDLTLSTSELAYAATSLQRLEAQASVDISGGQPSRLSLAGEDLRLAGQHWENLRLKGAGSPVQHVLEGTLASDLGRFELALDGSLAQDRQRWTGRLTQLSAQNTVLGNWNLDRPLSLQVTAHQVIAQPSCLVSPPTQLCLQGEWHRETGATGRLRLAHLDLQRLAFLLPPGTRLDTELSGEVRAGRPTGGHPQGKATFRLSPGRLTLAANGTPLEIPLPGGEILRAKSDGQTASATLQLGLGEIGQVSADARLSDLAGRGRVKGALRAQLTDLQFISALAPQVSNLSGRVLADLSMGGTLAAPVLSGEARLEEGAMEIPELVMRIQDIQLAALGDAQGQLQLSGSARSGEGELKLSGSLQPTTGRLQVHLKGENFQAANSPAIQARLSPDLNLSMGQGEMQVTGQLVVPQAKVHLGRGDGAGPANPISASRDVVIIMQADGSPQAPKPAPGYPLFAEVEVILGEVRVRAFDFDGGVKGKLMIRQRPGRVPRGTGTMEVQAGEYTISGQRLNIERGRVLFNNSPLDDPGLDLRVTRRIDNATHGVGDQRTVIAGAQVSGTLQNAKLTFFSTPAMPEKQILSYLVLGHGQSSGKGASFAIGKYLTPDLYAGYRIGMFQALSTFIVRYRLTERVSIEASSNSESTGGDVIYTLELP